MGTLDAQGRIRFLSIGGTATACTLVVEKDGYWPATFSVRDICVAPEGDEGCHRMSFAADLAPNVRASLSAPRPGRPPASSPTARLPAESRCRTCYEPRVGT
ncbi:MAG TPA: hypothetical protein VHB21_06370 [Minicystis sp.]|nr:hypothetical protein [Minicystis sp.]